MRFLANLLSHKLKLALLGAALAGPIVAIVGWAEIARTNHVLQDGTDARARLVDATRKTGRRGVTRYTIGIVWRDASGLDRKATDVEVSPAMAGRLFRDDRIVVGTVPIRYVAGERGRESVVLVDDVAEQLSDDRMMAYGGAAVGLVAIPAALQVFGLFGWLARRRARPREEFVRDGRAIMGSGREAA